MSLSPSSSPDARGSSMSSNRTTLSSPSGSPNPGVTENVEDGVPQNNNYTTHVELTLFPCAEYRIDFTTFDSDNPDRKPTSFASRGSKLRVTELELTIQISHAPKGNIEEDVYSPDNFRRAIDALTAATKECGKELTKDEDSHEKADNLMTAMERVTRLLESKDEQDEQDEDPRDRVADLTKAVDLATKAFKDAFEVCSEEVDFRRPFLKIKASNAFCIHCMELGGAGVATDEDERLSFGKAIDAFVGKMQQQIESITKSPLRLWNAGVKFPLEHLKFCSQIRNAIEGFHAAGIDDINTEKRQNLKMVPCVELVGGKNLLHAKLCLDSSNFADLLEDVVCMFCDRGNEIFVDYERSKESIPEETPPKYDFTVNAILTGEDWVDNKDSLFSTLCEIDAQSCTLFKDTESVARIVITMLVPSIQWGAFKAQLGDEGREAYDYVFFREGDKL